MLRPLMEEAYRVLEEGGIPIVIAPTSYGKTRASTEFYRKAVSSGLAAGLIHVVPMRSLVYSIFTDHFKPLGGGYQSMDAIDDNYKTPYYLKQPAVTTLESYAWNVFRVPVAEFAKVERGVSEGHYYPVLASINSSINVFDEAHLYLGDDSSLAHTTVMAALSYLATLEVPIVLETATMNPHVVRVIAETLSRKPTSSQRPVELLTLDVPDLRELVNAVLENTSRHVKSSIKTTIISDPQWVGENHFDWKTTLYKDEKAFIEAACIDAEDKLVLLIRNTVSKAIDSLLRAKSLCPHLVEDKSVVLLHGRLSNKDRAAAEEALMRLRERRRGIIVSTQVAEAGVDVNAHTVYSDVAPIENLVQRANRSCRRGHVLEYCRGHGARFSILEPVGNVDTIKGPYGQHDIIRSTQFVKQVISDGKKRLNWRIAIEEEPTEVGPGNLITKMANSPQAIHVGSHGHGVLGGLMEDYERFDSQPSTLLDLLENMGACSILSEDRLVKVYLSENDKNEYVVASLKWVTRILRSSQPHLRVDKSGNPILVIYTSNGEVALAPIERRKLRHQNCAGTYKAIKQTVYRAWREQGVRRNTGLVEWGFLARKGSYIEGLGFVSERGGVNA